MLHQKKYFANAQYNSTAIKITRLNQYDEKQQQPKSFSYSQEIRDYIYFEKRS